MRLEQDNAQKATQIDELLEEIDRLKDDMKLWEDAEAVDGEDFPRDSQEMDVKKEVKTQP